MSNESSKNKTVLVADDEECLLNVTSIILKECGYNVLVAHNGKEAVQITKTQQTDIDLLLTDMCMPDMDGSRLAAEFHLAFPQGKVIYMTAYAQEEMQKQFPGESILEKPFDLRSLSNIVGATLSIAC